MFSAAFGDGPISGFFFSPRFQWSRPTMAVLRAHIMAHPFQIFQIIISYHLYDLFIYLFII